LLAPGHDFLCERLLLSAFCARTVDGLLAEYASGVLKILQGATLVCRTAQFMLARRRAPGQFGRAESAVDFDLYTTVE
jgi:hypothetical protein